MKSVLSNKKTILSIVAALSFLASFTTCYFSTPTIFGGRDQGAIATAAISLAKHKSLTSSTPVSEDLFQKYGPGRALNFPGFNYTENGKLISRFPKAYVAFLAAAYGLFGLPGIQYANFVPLFLFLIMFWLILKEFFSEKVSFLGFLLAATFFPFFWFAKYTLTEIFMLFLVWTGIYFLLEFRYSASKSEEAKPLYLFVSLAAFGLSALTRIEGIMFFLLAAVYISFLNRKKIIALPKNYHRYLFVSAIFLLIFYISLNFHGLTDSAKNIAKALLPNSAKDSAPSASLYAYLFRIFVNYGILPYLALGLAGIYVAAKNMRRDLTKSELAVIFVLFPSFIYLLLPFITLDDPWILRRFVFAVFPTLIFFTVYFLDRRIKNKALGSVVFIALIALNLAIASRYLTYSENKNLLPQTENISQKFSASDLILVDRLASGSGFSLFSEPLSTILGKQAVYFFNADDLKYIEPGDYRSIYLVAPADDAGTWYNGLNKQLVETVVIKNNFLKPSQKYFELAKDVEIANKVGIWKLK